jgi:hypothetical protein
MDVPRKLYQLDSFLRFPLGIASPEYTFLVPDEDFHRASKLIKHIGLSADAVKNFHWQQKAGHCYTVNESTIAALKRHPTFRSCEQPVLKVPRILARPFA